MRFLSLKISIATAILFSVALNSCTDKKDDFALAPVTDYLQPLEPGKYITYRVDSLVFTNFGANQEIHKYQQKHVVEARITDNLGRPSWKIVRYIRDSVDATSWTPAQAWIPNGSYFITVTNDQLEVIEDNLRIIRLHLPIKEGFSWNGNLFLGSNPYNSLYRFSNDDYMHTWEYYYNEIGASFSYGNKVYNDVLTVEIEDEVDNVPIADPTAYASRTRAVDRYSKNIGLVYREWTMWEYQPNTTGPGGPYKTGFGITMWMIDHN